MEVFIMKNTTTTTAKTTKYFDFDKITIADALQAATKARDNKPAAVVNAMVKEIRKRIAIDNASAKKAAFEKIALSDNKAAAYLDNMDYTINGCGYSQNDGYKLTATSKRLHVLEIEAFCKKSYNKHFVYDTQFFRMLCHFYRDLYNYTVKNLNDARPAKSMVQLEKDLNAVTVALFGDVAPKMQKKDIRFLSQFCLKFRKDKIDADAEKDSISLLVFAVITRKNGIKEYTVNDNFKYTVDGEKIKKASKASKKAAKKS